MVPSGTVTSEMNWARSQPASDVGTGVTVGFVEVGGIGVCVGTVEIGVIVGFVEVGGIGVGVTTGADAERTMRGAIHKGWSPTLGPEA